MPVFDPLVSDVRKAPTAPPRSREERLTNALSGAVLLLTFAAVAGWLFDVPALTSILPDRVTMKFNTAIGLAIAGLALRGIGEARAVGWRRLARYSAAFVALLGAVTLSEYAFGWDLGIDDLFLGERPDAVRTTVPGRMSPQTALNFMLVGYAYLLAGSRNAIGRWTSWTAMGCVAVIALLALAGHLYGVRYLYLLSTTTGVALNTAIAFLLLGAGYFTARHESNHEAVFFSNSTGGTTARLLSPVAILLPLTLGWFRVAGERAGLYDSTGGAALMMVLMITLFTALIGLASRSLHRTDLALRAASEDRERTIAQLQQSLEELDTLRGLLPICAWCSKIRNESGDWKVLAAYVTDHTAASVTHGICPDCAKTHFDGA